MESQPKVGITDEAFDSLLWDEVKSGAATGSFDDFFRESVEGEPPALNFTTVLSLAGNPLPHIARHANVRVQQVTAGGTNAIRFNDAQSAKFVVSAWPTVEAGVYHVVSTAPASNSTWQKVERWIANASPDVSRFFLDRNDFDDIIDALASIGDVMTNRLTWHTREHRTSTHRGFPEHPLAREAIQQIIELEGGVQIRTAHLVVAVPDVSPVLRTYLRRQAGASFNGGDFALFSSKVLGRLAEAGSRRITLLHGRERQIGQRPPAPVSIKFYDAYFDDADDTGRLVHELVRYRHGDVAVLHRNPYLHLVVTDYTDGSNFDIFVTEEDEISVYGGYKASVGATARLTEYLSDRFAAEELRADTKLRPVTLEELFVAG